MGDASEFVNAIKKAAADAVEAGKPMNVVFGTVMNAAPLMIATEQQMLLGVAQLILSRNVTTYAVPVTINWSTGTKEGHTHAVSGSKTMVINNGLVVGDKVWMIREQGGQRFLVVDRVVGV